MFLWRSTVLKNISQAILLINNSQVFPFTKITNLQKTTTVVNHWWLLQLELVSDPGYLLLQFSENESSFFPSFSNIWPNNMYVKYIVLYRDTVCARKRKLFF